MAEGTVQETGDGMRRPRVGVIGAGIAGLVTAKVLRADGFDVRVFEKEPAIGGVWVPSRTYPGLRTNNPRETYAFADFPYSETTDEFPTAEQVRSYLGSYVDRFGLRESIRLSRRVVSVARAAPAGRDGPRFRVSVRSTNGTWEAETLDFDFVAVCNGVFSEPYLPDVEGAERFAGRVLHSSQLAGADAVDGKRVVVVGAGKSALDCATLAARRAASCTLVFRSPHWMVPRYLFGAIRMDRLFMTRFSELLLRYHRPSRVEALLHGPGKPLVRLFWRAQSSLLARTVEMPRMLRPEHPLPMGFENIGVGGELYEVLRQKRLAPKRGGIASFAGATTVELDSGEQVEADTVVFATGWRQDVSFLEEDLRASVRKNGKFQLYRNILPPREPHLGFVGYASSIACQLTSELAAHWLSQCFRGELCLPSAADMEAKIARVQQWVDEVFPRRKESYFIGPFLAHYVDELMRDMGLKTHRTRDPFTEYLAPFMPSRYRGLGEERRRARGRSSGGGGAVLQAQRG
jgi:dimethylaniline monooxygenase (N-oxide forming)